MKRFYRQVNVVEDAGGFAITLDDKRLKSPGQRELDLPTHGLAMAIRREWAEQGDAIQPRTMPMMQLASTMVDRVRPQRDAAVDTLLRYGGSDLLCYRADRPEALVTRQEAVWQPLIDWVAARHRAELTVTRGMMPVSQPQAALDALAASVAAHQDPHLTAMLVAAAASSSLVLALALASRHLTAAEAYAASVLDETYQSEIWGEDWEAADQRAERRADIEAAARFIALSEGTEHEG